MVSEKASDLVLLTRKIEGFKQTLETFDKDFFKLYQYVFNDDSDRIEVEDKKKEKSKNKIEGLYEEVEECFIFQRRIRRIFEEFNNMLCDSEVKKSGNRKKE